MAAAQDDLEKRLSGGAANTDPDLSLGGAKSTEVVLSQTAVINTPISGVTMVEGRGNTVGLGPTNGSITFVQTNTALKWSPPGTVNFGLEIDVSVDGRYTLPGPETGGFDDALLIVDVVAASLPISDIATLVEVTTPANELFDDVGAIEAFLGATNYRCYYVENRSGADTLFGVKVFIGSQPSPSGHTLAVGLDPAGINGVAVVTADEDTAPVGPVFSSPSTYAAGLNIGDLTPGDFQAIWIRRTVAPGSVTPAPQDVSETVHGMFF